MSKILEVYEKVKDSVKVLESNPKDPNANREVGMFRCFFQQDWERGIIDLSWSSDEVLSKLAQLELADTSGWQTQLKLGDGWWDYGESVFGTVATASKARAAKWYELSLPLLKGLDAEKAKSRVKEVDPTDVTQTSNDGALLKKGQRWRGRVIHTKGPSAGSGFDDTILEIKEVKGDNFEGHLTWVHYHKKGIERGNGPVAGTYSDGKIKWGDISNGSGAEGAVRANQIRYIWSVKEFGGTGVLNRVRD